MQDILGLASPLVPMAAMVMVIFIVYYTRQAQKARIDAQKDVQLALLHKFNNGDELLKFLETEEGKRLLEKLTPDKPSQDPKQKISDEVTGGIITLCIGIGLLFLRNVFVIPGMICLFTGIGLLAAALVTYIISKKSDLPAEPKQQ